MTHGLGRVLVVDDDEVIRRLIAVNLQLEGFDVETAVDGQDCLERVAEIDPDVITLDVMMPRLDGWETAVQLRKSPETAHIKVVLITARAQEDDKNQRQPGGRRRLPHQAVRPERDDPRGPRAGQRRSVCSPEPTLGDHRRAAARDRAARTTRSSGRARRRAATRPACRSGSTPATPGPPPRSSPPGSASELWIATAEVTGPGFVTVTVTHATLARLAIRIAHAGPACAESDALAGRTVPAPRPAAVADWPQARAALAAELTVRLAAAAGAIIDPERAPVPAPPPPSRGPVAEAIAYAGPDAVRFALARMPPGGRPPEAAVIARHVLANPAYAVRYAHAAAAAVLRWAAALGIRPAGFTPRLLAEPGELALLDALSWLPERVAVAARRGRPDEFAGYLAELAARTIDTMSTSSFRKIPDISSERLWLADAARTGLAAGLGLLGIDAPPRL